MNEDTHQSVLDYITEKVPQARIFGSYQMFPTLGAIRAGDPVSQSEYPAQQPVTVDTLSGTGPTQQAALDDLFASLDRVMEGMNDGIVLDDVRMSTSGTNPVRYRYTLTAGFVRIP